LIAKVKKKEKYSLHHYKHANCSRILAGIRKEYILKEKPYYLAVPYVLMCATTLEARLNDALYDHAFHTWGEKYKAIADAYLSMSFRGKLNSLVPILTNDKYRISQEHFVYQRLASLISVRNLLAHLKPTIEKLNTLKTNLGHSHTQNQQWKKLNYLTISRWAQPILLNPLSITRL
jgi:hypothetical protein